MSQPPLRFVHSSDFHLERPLGGVAEVPEALREAFLEAPYQAAQQVFETALSEGADAVLLAGDVVDIEHAGPRAIVFLIQQFQRLDAAGIPVYWAGGIGDPPDAWPACAPLPDNVHVFPVGRVETVQLQRNGRPLACIQGTSRTPGKAVDDAGFHCDANRLFTIGVAYGTAASPGEEGDRVNYMALGGQHRRQTVDQSPGVAHYSGTPQGRTPAESSARGCTVVTVDEAGHVKSKFVAADSVRWLDETIEITAGTDEQALLDQLYQRAERVAAQHPDRTLLVSWHIRGRGALVNRLLPGGVADDLLEQLRRRYAEAPLRLWNVSLNCGQPVDMRPEVYDQETILGDVLRQFRDLESRNGVALDLEAFLPEDFNGGPYAELANVADADRDSLLTASAKLALQLLHADDE